MQNYIKTGTITANYKNGKYIKECLKGLIHQTKRPDIICIVDDGSPYSDWELIYQSLDDIGCRMQTTQPKMDGSHIYGWHFGSINTTKVAFFAAKDNKGPARARNIAASYLVDRVDVMFVADSDDVYYPDKIQKSIDVMKKYEHVGLVYSDYDTYTEKDNTLKREYKEPFNMQRLTQECIVSNNSAILSKAFKIAGPYDESLYGPEDYDMWLRIADHYAVYHIPEALYKYRITGNNLTIATPKQQFAQHVQRVYEKARERYAKKV